MDREADIFDQDVQGSGDLDVDLANASHLLQKLAEEEGIDLNKLSDEDVASLISDLYPAAQGVDNDQETRKEAAMATENESAEIPALTYADVALELTKIAAEKGIDLSQASREEYAEAFDKLAESMSDPAVLAAKVAEEEKLAEAYVQGQRMADGFLDRLKAAEDDDEKAAREKRERKEREEKEGKTASELPPSFLRNVKEKVVGAARGATAKARDSKLVEAAREHGTKHKGRYTHGGAAAAGAAAGAVAGAASRRKEALDGAALEVAREIALDMGIDPDTGEKIAEGFTEDEVAARATEMLKEAGLLAAE